MSDLPFVSAVIPCRNEEKYIRRCLESLAGNDYPKNRLEILVVDGMSSDGTHQIIAELQQRFPFIRHVANPRETVPAAMNTGVQSSQGQILMIISAHSTYPPNYISKCIDYLGRYPADNVGGVLRIIPGSESTVAKAISLALSHPFGSGNSYVKVGSKEVRWADTAAYGCWPREVFEKVGPWNEDLAGSSDLDFSLRLKKAGGKTLLVPEIEVSYHSDPNFRSFLRHNFADGVWATYVLKFKSKGWAWRHWVPLGFVSGLVASLCLSLFWWNLRWVFLALSGIYVATNLLVSLQISLRNREPGLTLPLFASFAMRHLVHGIGALYGLFLLLIPGRHWSGRRTAKV